MDEVFVRDGQVFEWDPAKAAGNLAKHGIAFHQAAEVFLAPFVQACDAGEGQETREGAVGLTGSWQLIFVVYRIGAHRTIRIISARQATQHERRKYENE
ncbi:MAG TPA: BrnT family toxin [Holophaga sp.]|nr:BrnT family toxin [Holophaga sp.]